MKALRSFTVRPHLPAELAGLGALAQNLRWSWDRRTRSLFESVDPTLWDRTVHDPVRLLGEVDRKRLEQLATDPHFRAELDEIHGLLEQYLDAPRWFQTAADTPLKSIAYFSPEFGISEALPQYSGGLGVLAGDHLKAASDLGVPLVGVGLFYRHGYFRQSLNIDGWQQERYPDLDPYAMALTLVEDLHVTVDFAGTPGVAQVWRADVGRIPLYLLDADIDENPPEIRQVTDRLYGGDIEHRLRQEILLGVGGVRAIQGAGEPAQIFHTNEGHAGFLGLERIRQFIHGGLSYREAIEATRSGCLFTTHTPVPAGIDRFPRELIEKYFGAWATECGVRVDELMALGHRPGDQPDERFNMAVMGMRLAARSNGVSKLHGEVSREMFSDLWPDVPTEETPITSVTNGVHGRTWIAPEVDDLLARTVDGDWHSATDNWDAVRNIAPEVVWRTRDIGTVRLVDFVRDRVRSAGLAQGLASSDLAWTDTALDPGALTICFARRFATYKRATLLLSQPNRLRALLTDPERPVQFVFAGKAHPADDSGKELIRHIVSFSHELGIRHRFAFVDDYDIAVARALYQGADVWLNNPRRPLEACGTSGEKAALNGALNCSILDGWWDEMFTGDNGWAVSTAEGIDDLERRDELEANSLFDLLEQQVVPLFYDRSGGALPIGWIDKMKAAWHTLGPQVTANRMVRDYVTELYEPLADLSTRLDDEAVRDLAAWKAHVRDEWHGVHIDTVDLVDPDMTVAEVGSDQPVTARVALGALSPNDVQVQLVHGLVGQHDAIEPVSITAMERDGDLEDGHFTYRATLRCERTGRYGINARVVPDHPNQAQQLELGHVASA